MPNIALSFSLLFIVLGLSAYFGTGMTSWTALIPAIFGVGLLALALLSRTPARQKLALRASAAWALLGFLGTVGGIAKTIKLFTGGDVARPQAAFVQAIMALVCIAYLALWLRSALLDRTRARPA